MEAYQYRTPPCKASCSESKPYDARSWMFRLGRNGKPRRVTLCKADAVKAGQAPAAELAVLARENDCGNLALFRASDPTLAKFAAEYVERRSLSWKPSTVTATVS